MKRDTIEPIFEIADNIMLDIADIRVGTQLQGILNGRVIEKTKSFIILQIDSAYLLPSRRKF